MEIWDLYDKNRLKTNRTMKRGRPLKKGDYHLVVHVCIFNSQNQMLIQKRQPFKEGWSNMWDITVGGSATTGDDSSQAAQRELYEEIGFAYDFSDVRPQLTINFEYGFDDYYLIEQDLDIKTLFLQESEVQAVQWASEEEIYEMIDAGVFIPYRKSLIALFFDMKSSYGNKLMD